MSDHSAFAAWLTELVTAAGYDLSSPRSGGRSKLAADTGISLSQIQRALSGDSRPDIQTQRILAKTLGVPPREMFIQSGTIDPADLQGMPETVSDLDVRQLGLKLGVPAGRLGIFEDLVRAVAQTLQTDGQRTA
ncbi:helix-turn-helix domain-containing protein [Kitasatospora sp. NPDC001175]|uniref:helix-turn-helix domain-containing protein n=1 Tax=Kitasatospora sp. NPDC001175 TaxID=3157103 RepID=UPI003CFD14A8